MAQERNLNLDTFFEKAIPYEGDNCLIWPFGLLNGYPEFDRLAKVYKTPYVHRAVCIEVYGPPPTPDHQVAHAKKCSSKQCVNNKHLRWATPKENMADDQRGEDAHKSKLTEEQVIEIRKLTQTMSQHKLGTKYGVSQKAIWFIINRKNWYWLEEPSDAELIFDTTRPRMKDLFA